MTASRFAAVLCRVVVIAVLALGTAVGRAGGTDYERWYVVEMVGQRAGWMMSSQETANGTITNRSKMTLTFKREAAEISIYFESEFVETTGHKPVSMRSLKRMGTLPVEMVYTFGETGVNVETTQGGPEKTVSEAALPQGAWLTPAGAGEFVAAQLAAGTTTIKVRTMDPLNGVVPMEVTREVLSRTNVVSMGATVPAIKCRVTQDLVPIPSIDWIDADGVPIRVETSIGAINLAMQETSKEEATAEGAAPEIMVSTFVKPDRRIARPRYKKTGAYTLSVPDGQALGDLPQCGAQRFERIDGRSARVTVEVLDPLPAEDADRTNPDYLGSSSLIDAADPAIVAMAGAAVKDAGNTPAARAEAIRRFVHDSISTKDLDIGFASATEVARTHEGDCTEHAVLLAAVLRAAGIKSRVVSGLVYAEGFAGQSDIFGYHMWAQALLEDDGKARWIDLDGTLGENTTFDATHIALAVSALNDGQTYEALAPMATVIGQLSIKVDSAE